MTAVIAPEEPQTTRRLAWSVGEEMYYIDLDVYEEEGYRLPLVRRIGWLSSGQPFPQGNVPTDFVMALRKLSVHGRVNQTRGFHCCELCDEEDVQVVEGDTRAFLGSAEIWVPGARDTAYAAPDLLLHYVVSHSYQSPREFEDAVLALDLDAFNADAFWQAHRWPQRE